MARFKRGESGNPNGRPKGSKNRIDKDVKAAMEKVLTFNLEGLQADLDEMSPKDKWQVLNKMSDKILPNLKSVDMDVTADAEVKVKSIGFEIDYVEDDEEED